MKQQQQEGPLSGSFKLQLDTFDQPQHLHMQYNPAYGPVFPTQGGIEHNNSTAGESIEQRVARILNNNEPLTDGAPLIYSQRKDGVEPMYNIRTDRFELAVEAMDHVTKTALAKRAEFQASLEKQNEPQPGTSNTSGTEA